MSGPPVTVAVVSFNTRELLVRCLRSLGPEVAAGRASVWVVDNASDDGSAQAAREVAPWAEVVEAGGNLGFGAAVDLVASRTSSEWIAPANADIALRPRALEALVAAGGDPRTAVVAPRLVLPDGGTQHSVHPFPTLRFVIAFNLGLARVSGRFARAAYLQGHFDPDRPGSVDWAIGAFLLVRRSAFAEVGGFDAAQWMYAEDLDLGWRLARAGYRTRYAPEAHVEHEESAATDAAFGDEKMARFMGATYAVIARRRGLRIARATGAVNTLGAAARVVWMTPLAVRSPRWRHERQLALGWMHAHRRGLRALDRAALSPARPARPARS